MDITFFQLFILIFLKFAEFTAYGILGLLIFSINVIPFKIMEAYNWLKNYISSFK